MKTIGLIGGMSWESSVEYYRLINLAVREKLGGLHSARSVMVSVDFSEVEEMQRENRWGEATQTMIAAARQVERAGADFVLICTNTMHRMADEVQQAIRIPLLHIADATGQVVCSQGIRRIGLLGTRYTMEENFYRGRLLERFGLRVLVPDQAARETVHRVIYEELCQGIIMEDSRREYRNILSQLVSAGAEGVILGCTEIGLLVHAEDSSVPLFDTTGIHAQAAVDYALLN
ncbi:MAG TPA: aspartate/glutamate racemase family protein [Anaerolineaceae bacterium]|nr:aspartate/glutamate racemase family protein [Anaerolineaceae bacterium]